MNVLGAHVGRPNSYFIFYQIEIICSLRTFMYTVIKYKMRDAKRADGSRKEEISEMQKHIVHRHYFITKIKLLQNNRTILFHCTFIQNPLEGHFALN